MPPHQSYLICATPRSGSYLLCEALANTGVAGRPAEYFWSGDEQLWAEDWGLGTYAYGEFLAAALEHGSTPNGVFGAKVMWGYFQAFVEQLRSVTGDATRAAAPLLDATFPDLQYIWLRRRDTVRQAVSDWRAMQTQVWSWEADAPQIPQAEAVYSFEEIDRLVREKRAQDRAWRRYFSHSGIEPLRLVYEQFVDDYEGTVEKVLQFLCVPIPEDLGMAQRRMRRQADRTSEDWVRRFRAERRELTL